MITTIRRKIGVTLAIVLAAVSFAPAALADPPQFQLRRHAPEVQVKEDPFLFRGHDVGSGGGATLVNGRAKPDGYQPQLSVTDNPVLLRGYGGTEPRNRGLVARPDGPDGYQPQLRGFDPTVTVASGEGIDWVAAGSGVGIGVGLSALMLAALAVARTRRLAHS
ncbi:MAG: hypothetical protein ACRDNE_12165 [Gaiellaceae bacterium]